MPPASSTASSSSSRLGALRIAAVATANTCSAPTCRATLACVRTTSAVSAILAGGIAPPVFRLLPMRVNARCVTSSRSCPSFASATSSLVVLLPMSIQAQIKVAIRARSAEPSACGLRRSKLRVRGVLELPEQTGDDEGGLLADVHGIVADSLDAARNEHHVHRPLAAVGIVADLEREVEDVAVEAIDLVVLADQILGELHVPPREGLLALHDLRARLLAHPLDVAQDALVGRRLVARERYQLRHVHALVAHALDVLHHVKEGSHEAEVSGHRRLEREQGENSLVHLEVAAVDAVVVGDDHAGQLDVLVQNGLERPIEGADDHVETAEGLFLELGQLLLELQASRVGHASAPTRPCR